MYFSSDSVFNLTIGTEPQVFHDGIQGIKRALGNEDSSET
jgi:hypothetical protein